MLTYDRWGPSLAGTFFAEVANRRATRRARRFRIACKRAHRTIALVTWLPVTSNLPRGIGLEAVFYFAIPRLAPENVI